MKRLIAMLFVAALAGCGSGGSNGANASTDPCDTGGIAKAIDATAASGDAPAKRADELDNIAADVVQCEAASETARTDPKDPLNLQLARANLAAGKAYALAGKIDDARGHLANAAFTAKFIGDTRLETEAAAALQAVH